MEKYNIPYVEKDGIFYPCITFSEDAPIGEVGKYGLMWITYMKENHDYRYRHLVRTGELNATAIEVDEEANAMADTIIEKYLRDILRKIRVLQWRCGGCVSMREWWLRKLFWWT